MISLDLMKSSEVRIAGDWSTYIRLKNEWFLDHLIGLHNNIDILNKLFFYNY